MELGVSCLFRHILLPKDLEGEFFFAVAALKRAWLLSCCLLRQPAGSEPEPNCFTLYILWVEKIHYNKKKIKNFS